MASRLPRPTDHPIIYSDVDDLVHLAHRRDGPQKLADFLYSDEPQLSFHVISFRDATLVSVSWLHTFLDAAAISIVLKAWVSVLNGQENDVPSIANFDMDPLATLGTAATEPFVLAKHQLGGLGMLKFGLRYLLELLFYRDEKRVIYIPASSLRAMKAAALDNLNWNSLADKQTVSESNPIFISDGDILCAFLSRLAVLNEAPNSTRQITIMNAFNLRSVLSSSYLPPTAGVCLSNVISGIWTLTTARDLIEKPLGNTALLIRKSLVEQSKYEQIEALAALTRTTFTKTGRPPFFGDGGTRMLFFSNWSKADFFNLDFGAAVKEGWGILKTDAKPTFVNAAGNFNGVSPRGSWPILGMDGTGGYWIYGNLTNGIWDRIEKELAWND